MLSESGVLGSKGLTALPLPEGAGSDLWSGSSPVVLADDAAEDVATNDGTATDRRDRGGDRLGELQAAMRSRFVVVPDVLVEHRFEVSS